MEDIQVLAKRGATPHGPAYGYKEVTDETEKKDYYSNPFNQKIRGAHKESIENQAEDSGEVKKEGEEEDSSSPLEDVEEQELRKPL